MIGELSQPTMKNDIGHRWWIPVGQEMKPWDCRIDPLKIVIMLGTGAIPAALESKRASLEWVLRASQPLTSSWESAISPFRSYISMSCPKVLGSSRGGGRGRGMRHDAGPNGSS
jgi:hypothetical protein